MCGGGDGGLVERLLNQVKRAGVADGVDAEEHARAVAAEVERAHRAAEQRHEVNEMKAGLLRDM